MLTPAHDTWVIAVVARRASVDLGGRRVAVVALLVRLSFVVHAWWVWPLNPKPNP